MAEILLDNDKVRIIRDKRTATDPYVPDPRCDRVIYYETASAIRRTTATAEADEMTLHTREAGEVVWRPASDNHTIDILHDDEHSVLIFELKD